jgi:hypothetical protein
MALSYTVMHSVNSVQERCMHASTAIIAAYLCCSGYIFAVTLLTLFTVLCIRGYVVMVQFLDCVPGQSYVKEFSVWNKSQVCTHSTAVIALLLSCYVHAYMHDSCARIDHPLSKQKLHHL